MQNQTTMVGFNENNCRFQGEFDPYVRGRHWSPDPLLSRIIEHAMGGEGS